MNVPISHSVFTKNRAEEFGHDVWKDFVVPLFYDKLDLRDAKKGRIIVGGRGCGKTMLLRYLSHYSQFSQLRDKITEDELKYIGLYWKADTQFATTLIGRGKNIEFWNDVFSHVLALIVVKELLKSLESVADSNYKTITKETLTLTEFKDLAVFGEEYVGNFYNLSAAVTKNLRYFQLWKNNIGKVEEPLFLPGKEFVLAVIGDIKTIIPEFIDTNFFVYIDEYENLLEYQQCIINTYIKHSEIPLVFNIAMKRLGMKVRDTVGNEKITNISDYRIYDLENLSDEREFKIFSAEILFLRLKNNMKIELPIKKETLQNPDELHIRKSTAYQENVLKTAENMFPGSSLTEISEKLWSEKNTSQIIIDRIKKVLADKQIDIQVNDIISSNACINIILPCLIARKTNAIEMIKKEIVAFENGKVNKFYGPTNWVQNYLFASRSLNSDPI